MKGISCRQKILVKLCHIKLSQFSPTANIPNSWRCKCVTTVMDQCSAAMRVTKFRQADNEASNHAFGKHIFSWCDDSCVGTEICLLPGRCMIRNVVRDYRGPTTLYKSPTTLYKSLMRSVLVNVTKTKLSKIWQQRHLNYLPSDSNKANSSFAGSCLRNLLFGSAFIFLRWLKLVGIIQQ